MKNFIVGQMVVMTVFPAGDTEYYKELLGPHQVCKVTEIGKNETHYAAEYDANGKITGVVRPLRESAGHHQYLKVAGSETVFSGFYFRHATEAELRQNAQETRQVAKSRL